MKQEMIFKLIEMALGENAQSETNLKESAQFEVGKQYLIRTVTNYYVGVCERVGDQSVKLGNAAWIPDTGRFNDCLKLGEFEEVEPYIHGVTVWFGGIIDHTLFNGNLPTEQK